MDELGAVSRIASAIINWDDKREVHRGVRGVSPPVANRYDYNDSFNMGMVD